MARTLIASWQTLQAAPGESRRRRLNSPIRERLISSNSCVSTEWLSANGEKVFNGFEGLGGATREGRV